MVAKKKVAKKVVRAKKGTWGMGTWKGTYYECGNCGRWAKTKGETKFRCHECGAKKWRKMKGGTKK